MYVYRHAIGTFLIDDSCTIHDSELISEGHDSTSCYNQLHSRHPHAVQPPDHLCFLILSKLKEQSYRHLFYPANIPPTQTDIISSVTTDSLIIQAAGLLDEIDRAVNILSKRLREWHSLTYPELEHNISDHFHYAQLISQHTNSQIEHNLNLPNQLGAVLSDNNLLHIKQLAVNIVSLYTLRQYNESYITELMHNYCPNLATLAGPTIAARLIVHARSLKRLAMLPASTIQLFGAEKALFRHLKTGSRSPKYGLIINHPLVQNSPAKNKGKAARILADKLSLCARLDYFHGEFKAPAYQQELLSKLAGRQVTNVTKCSD